MKKIIIYLTITFILIFILNAFTYSQVSKEDILLEQAYYFIQILDYESAIATLENILKSNPYSSTAYNMYGIVYSNEEEYEEAIKMFKKGIESDSTNLAIYQNLANAYIDNGDIDLAINLHKELIGRDSTNADNFVNLGDAYMKKNDISQAQFCFVKAVELNPYHRLAHINLAVTYSHQKKYKEAIDEFYLVRNLDDWYPLLRRYLREVSSNAESDFEEWIEKEPNNSEAHYYYSFHLWYNINNDDAKDELKEAIRLNGTSEKYYLRLADLIHNGKKYLDAIPYCQKCLEMNPNNWMCQNEIARNYMKLGNFLSAIQHLQRSIEIDSLVIESKQLLGIVYGANGEYEKAVKLFNEAISLGLKNPFIYLNLGSVYYNLGEYEKAWENAMIAKNMNFSEEGVKEMFEEGIDNLINAIQHKMK